MSSAGGRGLCANDSETQTLADVSKSHHWWISDRQVDGGRRSAPPTPPCDRWAAFFAIRSRNLAWNTFSSFLQRRNKKTMKKLWKLSGRCKIQGFYDFATVTIKSSKYIKVGILCQVAILSKSLFSNTKSCNIKVKKIIFWEMCNFTEKCHHLTKAPFIPTELAFLCHVEINDDELYNLNRQTP